MPNLKRKDLEARYLLFQRFALEDQGKYYERTIKRHRAATKQVNQLRALIAFLTGIASAAVGTIAAMGLNNCELVDPDPNCSNWSLIINTLIFVATALPAFAAFFNMLADLFQWDKLISIYDAAQENIEVADAHSPIAEMPLQEYRASFQAYAQGTLDVMSDETAQWGQSIRTPKGMEEYLANASKRSIKVGGQADQHQLGFVDGGDDSPDSSAESPAEGE